MLLKPLIKTRTMIQVLIQLGDSARALRPEHEAMTMLVRQLIGKVPGPSNKTPDLPPSIHVRDLNKKLVLLGNVE